MNVSSKSFDFLALHSMITIIVLAIFFCYNFLVHFLWPLLWIILQRVPVDRQSVFMFHSSLIASGTRGNSKYFLPPVNNGKMLNLELRFETQSHM